MAGPAASNSAPPAAANPRVATRNTFFPDTVVYLVFEMGSEMGERAHEIGLSRSTQARFRQFAEIAEVE